jgi:hypothetical protein
MGRIRSGHRMALLRLSALGFAVLTGVLAFSYFSLFEVLGSTTPALSSSDLRLLVLNFTLPAMPGAALSWWLLVVLPRRSSAAAGAWAGLLTIVFAPLEVGVGGFVFGGFSTASLTPWQVIGWTLAIWLFGLLIVCATPQGWGMLLLGAAAGTLYGTLIGRGLSETPRGEAASAAGLSPHGSQEEEHRVEREAADASQNRA